MNTERLKTAMRILDMWTDGKDDADMIAALYVALEDEFHDGYAQSGDDAAYLDYLPTLDDYDTHAAAYALDDDIVASYGGPRNQQVLGGF